MKEEIIINQSKDFNPEDLVEAIRNNTDNINDEISHIVDTKTATKRLSDSIYPEKKSIKRNFLPVIEIVKISRFTLKNLFTLKNKYEVRLIVKADLKNLGMLQDLKKGVKYKLTSVK